MPPLRASVLLVLLLPGAAAGTEFRDPAGFSFEYPEGWFVVTRELLRDGVQHFPPTLKAWIENNNVDLSIVSAMVIRSDGERFLENMNIVVEPQQIQIEESTVRQLETMLDGQYRQMSLQPKKIFSGLRTYGANEAITFEYEHRVAGVAEPMRQKQVYFAGGGKTFIVTCTGLAANFDKYLPAFDATLASFRIPVKVATGFDWNKIINSAVIGGAIAGIAVYCVRRKLAV